MKTNGITETSEIVGHLYQTKDYSIFKSHVENRDLDTSHANGIYQSMMKKGWIRGSVVAIGGDGTIFEGHTRVACAQKANVPIEYIIVSEPIENLISELNMNRKEWKLVNHMNTYIIRGNEHYITLGKFVNESKEFSITDCIMICKNSTTSEQRKIFDSGQFVVGDMDVARKWVEQLRQVKPYLPIGYCRGPFVRAMASVFLKPHKFNFDEFHYKLKLYSKPLKEHQTIREYSTAIEEIYNYKRREKIYLKK
jgi:hypothetical protein